LILSILSNYFFFFLTGFTGLSGFFSLPGSQAERFKPLRGKMLSGHKPKLDFYLSG